LLETFFIIVQKPWNQKYRIEGHAATGLLRD